MDAFKGCETGSPQTVLVGGVMTGEQGGILAGTVRTCREAPEPEPCIFLECSISVSWKVTPSILPSPAPLCALGNLPSPSAKLGGGGGGGSLQPEESGQGPRSPLLQIGDSKLLHHSARTM